MTDPADNLFREERRTAPQIPLTTLEVVMGYMRTHTEEENARIDDVKGDLGRLETKVDKLIESINSWMDKEPGSILERCEEMFDEAIPAHKDNPDATPAEKRKEHRRAHAKWMQHVEDEMERWKKMREKISEWFIISALGAIVVWILWSVQTYLGKPPP